MVGACLIAPGELERGLGDRQAPVGRVGVKPQGAGKLQKGQSLVLPRNRGNAFSHHQAVALARASPVEPDSPVGPDQGRQQVGPRRHLGMQQDVEAAPGQGPAQRPQAGPAGALVAYNEIDAG